MEEILARRFAPFNFSAIPGFPNVVPSPNEWGDYLPRFREREEDNPAQHLWEFHELMHQWEIQHEHVLLKMFMFSLAGDALKWYHSLPPASISSLVEFHAAFTAHCQKLYPFELIFYNCCEGYNNCIQDRAASYVGCEDDPDDLNQKSVLSHPHSSASEEGYESEKDPEEEEDALGEVRELIKSLSAQLDRWEVERCAEDFPVLEADVLGGSFEEDIEDFIAVETLVYIPEEPVVSDLKKEAIGEEDCSLFLHKISHDVFTFGIEKEDLEIVPFLQDEEVWCSPSFNDYSVEEQQSPTSQIDDLGSSQPMYDSYESGSELDTQNFQEKTAEPSPLFTNERQCEEISPPEQQIEKQSFPTGPIYDDYDSDPWESQEEAPGEPEEQSKMQFTDCAEPVSEQPPPESSKPISVIHPPVLIRDIRPQVNNCVAEEVVCRQFPGIGHSFDDPVSEYMEWHFPYALEPPYFISTPACKEELKSVTVLLSRLHHLLVIIDRRKELLSRKLLEWLWWKFSFT
jgi:hypothetical protein